MSCCFRACKLFAATLAASSPKLLLLRQMLEKVLGIERGLKSSIAAASDRSSRSPWEISKTFSTDDDGIADSGDADVNVENGGNNDGDGNGNSNGNGNGNGNVNDDDGAGGINDDENDGGRPTSCVCCFPRSSSPCKTASDSIATVCEKEGPFFRRSSMSLLASLT